MPAWAALVGLLNECPVMHAGISAGRGSGTHAVSATDFEFISENSQIASDPRVPAIAACEPLSAL